MRLRFTDPLEGDTSRVQRRWQRQSGRRAAAGGSSSSDSGSTGPYTENPVITPPPTETPSAGSFTINVAAIKFSGADTDYNPLYDREPTFPHPYGLKIEPPQWRKDPAKNEPISYVRGKKATVKLDITGSPNISDDNESTEERSIWVKVTPTAELRKQNLVKRRNDELAAVEDRNAAAHPLTFDPPDQTIEVSSWGAVDCDQLEFTMSALPNEVRLDALRITWDFKYGQTSEGPWLDVSKETTTHETYITYARSYEEFEPYYYPWKQVLRRACFYAHGADSPLQTSSLVTTGIYNSLEFNHGGNRSHSSYNNIKIDLWDMLRDGWVDCRDGSNYYTILMRWLGLTAWQIKISEDRGGFYYKTLRPISNSGDIHDDDSWSVRVMEGDLEVTQFSNWWAFHQVGIFNDEPNLGIDGPPDIDSARTGIYDPIIMVNRGRPTVPANMTKEAYTLALCDPVPHPTHGMNEGHNDWAEEGAVVGQVL